MATSFNEIMEIKAFLRTQFIVVSEEWTEACITFLKQEQPLLSSQNLKKNVHQQWLIADLEEIACPSLPQELPTAQKMTLNGQFALQVQGIRDISRPAYSQLKELTNSVNLNAEFSSAPKASVPEWEAKPTRMLMLTLTDGCIQVQGMEYKVISFLSPNFAPGIKVLIKGPIECRFGVLLLTSENISILGGAVESKLEQFSRENLLREQLQIEREDVNQNEPSEITSNNSEESPNNFRTSNNNANINLIQQNELNSRNSSLNSNPSTSLQNSENNAEDVLDHFDSDDDFEQNIDYGVLDEIENSQRQSASSQEYDENINDLDIWQEDEEMVRDLMEFQDASPEFKVPFNIDNRSSFDRKSQDSNANKVFTYLSTITNKHVSDCVVTIKGFIIKVLSKLECTKDTGYSLTVKINDGTATVDADIHDKVLENIMGVSAQTLILKKAESAENIEIRKEVFQTVSKCRQTLVNYNCLMDIKFASGEKPCIIKCAPVSKLHIKQLLDRVSSHF